MDLDKRRIAKLFFQGVKTFCSIDSAKYNLCKNQVFFDPYHLFLAIDPSCPPSITLSSLSSFLLAQHSPIPRSQTPYLFRMLDRSGSGHITYSDFLEAIFPERLPNGILHRAHSSRYKYSKPCAQLSVQDFLVFLKVFYDENVALDLAIKDLQRAGTVRQQFALLDPGFTGEVSVQRLQAFISQYHQMSDKEFQILRQVFSLDEVLTLSQYNAIVKNESYDLTYLKKFLGSRCAGEKGLEGDWECRSRLYRSTRKASPKRVTFHRRSNFVDGTGSPARFRPASPARYRPASPAKSCSSFDIESRQSYDGFPKVGFHTNQKSPRSKPVGARDRYILAKPVEFSSTRDYTNREYLKPSVYYERETRDSYGLQNIKERTTQLSNTLNKELMTNEIGREFLRKNVETDRIDGLFTNTGYSREGLHSRKYSGSTWDTAQKGGDLLVTNEKCVCSVNERIKQAVQTLSTRRREMEGSLLKTVLRMNGDLKNLFQILKMDTKSALMVKNDLFLFMKKYDIKGKMSCADEAFKLLDRNRDSVVCLAEFKAWIGDTSFKAGTLVNETKWLDLDGFGFQAREAFINSVSCLVQMGHQMRVLRESLLETRGEDKCCSREWIGKTLSKCLGNVFVPKQDIDLIVNNI